MLEKLNLVLDLDECVVHTADKTDLETYSNILSDPRCMRHRHRLYKIELVDMFGVQGLGRVSHHWGFIRPGAIEFLDFVISNIAKLVVWSAGRYQYVHRIVPCLFRDLERPSDIMTWDDIREEQDSNYSKPLTTVFRTHKEMNLSNTLILDDRIKNFVHNPENGILIPKYSPACSVEGILQDDICLYQFTQWLSNLPQATDVRRLNKINIFRTPFYKQVVTRPWTYRQNRYAPKRISNR